MSVFREVLPQQTGGKLLSLQFQYLIHQIQGVPCLTEAYLYLVKCIKSIVQYLMIKLLVSTWTEYNNILCDDQWGFRKNRNTVDHVSTVRRILGRNLENQRFVLLLIIRK